MVFTTGATDGVWSEVRHAGTLRWVPTRRLDVVEPARATVDGAGGPVTVHAAPGGTTPILGMVGHGSRVTLTGNVVDSGWTEVDIAGVGTGWVPTPFLDEG